MLFTTVCHKEDERIRPSVAIEIMSLGATSVSNNRLNAEFDVSAGALLEIMKGKGVQSTVVYAIEITI